MEQSGLLKLGVALRPTGQFRSLGIVDDWLVL